MYKCITIKRYSPEILSDNINSWFLEHKDAQIINICIVLDEGSYYYHAFITYSEKEE